MEPVPDRRSVGQLCVQSPRTGCSQRSRVVQDSVSRTIVHAVARLAADLGLDGVVEGVETDEQRRALHQASSCRAG